MLLRNPMADPCADDARCGSDARAAMSLGTNGRLPMRIARGMGYVSRTLAAR